MTLTKVVMVILLSLFFVSISIFSYKAMRKFVTETNKHEYELQNADPFREGAVAGDNNIFFVESSCATTDVQHLSSEQPGCGLRLSARATCAVEAAARLHPQRPVHVVHTCPLRCRERGGRPAHAHAHAQAHALELLPLPNVRLWHAGVRALLHGSPLAPLLDGAFQRSRWPVEHASDLVRLVLLWRFGGTYLDTDLYLLRPLGDLRNFVCVADNETVNNAVMDFAMDSVGRSTLNAVIAALRANYSSDSYAYNGEKLFSDALRKRCGKRKFSVEEEEDCQGVRLLPPAAFNPLPRASWRRLFEEAGADDTMRLVERSVGVHVWGHSSKMAPVHLRSRQPLAQLARDACPSVVAAAPDSM